MPRSRGSPEWIVGIERPDGSGKPASPHNQRPLTGISPRAVRSALPGWLCRMTCASPSSWRQRDAPLPSGRWSNRSAPNASAGVETLGNGSACERRRYQRSGCGISNRMPASSKSVESSTQKASASCLETASIGPIADRRAPLMSARNHAGSARNQRCACTSSTETSPSPSLASAAEGGSEVSHASGWIASARASASVISAGKSLAHWRNGGNSNWTGDSATQAS